MTSLLFEEFDIQQASQTIQTVASVGSGHSLLAVSLLNAVIGSRAHFKRRRAADIM